MSKAVVLMSYFLLLTKTYSGDSQVRARARTGNILLGFGTSAVSTAAARAEDFIPVRNFTGGRCVFNVSIAGSGTSQNRVFRKSHGLGTAVDEPSNSTP